MRYGTSWVTSGLREGIILSPTTAMLTFIVKNCGIGTNEAKGFKNSFTKKRVEANSRLGGGFFSKINCIINDDKWSSSD